MDDVVGCRSIIRGAAAAALVAAIAGCDWITIGEVPDAFAVLTGTVLSADGTPVRTGGVFYICGFGGPGGFAASIETGNDGRFQAQIERALYVREGTGSEFYLRCRLNAPAGSPPKAVRYVLVPFTSERSKRVTTIVHLQYGAVEELPPEWER